MLYGPFSARISEAQYAHPVGATRPRLSGDLWERLAPSGHTETGFVGMSQASSSGILHLTQSRSLRAVYCI